MIRGPWATTPLPDAPRPKLFPWVQALRAIAAGAVAFFHIANDAIVAGRDPSGLIARATASMPWIAGVDIFFVISGFVIVHASGKLFGQTGGSLRFLRRRLTRIVPLYWALTTLFLAMTLLQRSAIHGGTGGTGYVLASYLFIPFARPDGLPKPALGLGWTLNYEMFFYMMMTPFLLLPRVAAVAGCAAALCLLVGFGQTMGFGILPLQFWSDPIVLEFVLGMGLALAVARGFTLPGWARMALIAIALVWLHRLAGGPVAGRVVSFGLPGAMLVAAAVSNPRPDRMGTASRGLMRLGDASYAMYLFHPFVMRGFTLLGGRFATHTETSGVVYVAASLVVAQLCALAINAGFERKVMAMLRRKGEIRTGGAA
jgi:peptidoglycan/LPS O-acetylase OafA/YrhL